MKFRRKTFERTRTSICGWTSSIPMRLVSTTSRPRRRCRRPGAARPAPAASFTSGTRSPRLRPQQVGEDCPAVQKASRCSARSASTRRPSSEQSSNSVRSPLAQKPPKRLGSDTGHATAMRFLPAVRAARRSAAPCPATHGLLHAELQFFHVHAQGAIMRLFRPFHPAGAGMSRSTGTRDTLQ